MLRNKFLFLILIVFCFVLVNEGKASAQSPSFLWAAFIGDPTHSGGNANSAGIAVSALGYIVLTGGYTDAVGATPGYVSSVGFNTVQFPIPNNAGINWSDSDVFYSAYDISTGFNPGFVPTIQSHSSSTGGNISPGDLTFDGTGDLISSVSFSGYTTTPLNINLFGLPAVNIFNTGQDVVVQKNPFVSGGNYWANVIRGINLSSGVVIKDLKADLITNDVYVSGYFFGNVDFDPTFGSDIRTSSNIYEVFVTKYSSVGTYLWTTTFANAAPTQFSIPFKIPLAVGPSSIDVATGLYISATAGINFPGWTANPVVGHGTALNGDIGLISLNPSTGAITNVGVIGGAGTDSLSDMIDSPTGDKVVAGLFQGPADFDPGSGINLNSSPGLNNFVTKYTGSTLSWIRTYPLFGGGVLDSAKLASATCGSILTTGTFSVPTGVSVPALGLTTGTGIYVTKLDASTGTTIYNYPLYSNGFVTISDIQAFPGAPAFALLAYISDIGLGVFLDTCP